MTPYSPLEQERRNRGWSRAYVEEHFGIPHDTLSDAEKGKHKPRQALCETFCTIYSKTPEQLGLDKSSGIMVVEKKVVVTKHQGNNCIIVGVPEGNPMSDFLKSSFLTDLSSRLSSILNAWPRRNLYYEDLQAEVNKAITDYNACVDYDIAYAVTRRDACKSLMLIPLRLCGLDAVVQTSLIEIPKDAEGLLLHCAAGIAACWHMRQGKDIHLAYEIVSWYIPILQGVLSSQSERYRQAAAKLLAQCFMLKGRLAPSCENSMQAAVYLQQAIDYGDITENPTIQAITRRTMATHYAFEENWTQVLDYSQAAESFLTSTNADPIVHSFVASGLAMGHAAHEKTRKEAAPWLTKAQKNFESCKIPSCMQYSQAILMNCEGWARQFSEDYRGAANIFDQNIAISNTLTLGRICALFDRVETEMLRWDQPRDMDLCVRLWKEATQGAIELRSEQKFNTAYAHYKSLLIAFPGEEAIKRLRRGLVHW